MRMEKNRIRYAEKEKTDVENVKRMETNLLCLAKKKKIKCSNNLFEEKFESSHGSWILYCVYVCI